MGLIFIDCDPGCPSLSSDNDAIVSFLRDQPEDVIAGLADAAYKVAAIADGHLLPTNFEELYACGEYKPRSIMLGCNNDEGLMVWNYIAAGLKAAGVDWNADIARSTIQGGCSQLTSDGAAAERIAPAVLAEYLPDDVENTVKATVEFITDAHFISNTVSVANQCSRT